MGARILILTDHAGHTSENSLYTFASALQSHPLCESLDIASVGVTSNSMFFAGNVDGPCNVLPVPGTVTFESAKLGFADQLVTTNLSEYNVVVLRLPPPLSREFLSALTEVFPDECIINSPSGILETGSKQFLLRFPKLCAPMALIRNTHELRSFSRRFGVVLKPLQSYSGRGLVRIIDEVAQIAGKEMPLEKFIDDWGGSVPYLGMQYLRNVDQGDKRIIVCNGEVIGATLRLPKAGHWMCNIGQGGRSVPTQPDEREYEIAHALVPRLQSRGIILFGFDTLVDDQGQRVLSEINTTSIGGMLQLELQQNRPVVQHVAELIMKHIETIVDDT